MFRSPLTEQEVSGAYEQYGALIHIRCRRILRNEQAAEDAAQDTFMRLWRYGRSYRKAEAKLPWLYRVAERSCFDSLRKNKRAGEVTEAPEELAEHATPSGDGPQRLSDRDLVLAFLGRFDDRVKQIAVMHFLDGSSQEEIAEETGWSRQTVAKKLGLLRARASALRDSLYGANL